MRILHVITIIFLVSLDTLKAEFTVYNCTGKQLEIQFFYGNKPANTIVHIPASSPQSEKILPWKLIIPPLKVGKRRSFIITANGLENFLMFGPYGLWCSDKTFVIRDEKGWLVAGSPEKN